MGVAYCKKVQSFHMDSHTYTRVERLTMSQRTADELFRPVD